MNKMPKVSIVLPNYNHGRYLNQRIQSLLSQTHTDFELIIVDDGSTDNSIEVIRKYTNDRRVRTKFYSENSGSCYRRWNDGAQLAQGEYLLFAGADDYCHPTLLERLVEKLDKYPSVSLALSQSWEIDSTGRRLGSCREWTDPLNSQRWAKDFIDKGQNECRYMLFLNTIPNASAVLMRREIFLEAGGFDLQFKLSADLMLYVKMLLVSDLAFVAEPLNYFRTHANTIRNKYIKDGTNIGEWYKIANYIVQNTPNPKDVFEKACDTLANKWIQQVFVKHAPISLIKNKEIYKIASKFDPKINRRLFRTAVYFLKKKVFRRR